MKNSSDSNRNRSRYLAACIAVPQRTEPQRARERLLGFMRNGGENGGCVRKENISKNIRPYSGHRYLYPAHCDAVLDLWTCWGTSKRNRRKVSRGGCVQKFVGAEPSLRDSRQNIKNKIKHWVGKHSLAMWRGPGSTQKQARTLISDPSPTTKTRLLSLNRTQSRGIPGLLTGHNTLRRNLYLMEMINNLTCKKCGTGEGTSHHILCECEALASPVHAYLGSFFLDPEDLKNLKSETHPNISKGAGLP